MGKHYYANSKNLTSILLKLLPRNLKTERYLNSRNRVEATLANRQFP